MINLFNKTLISVGRMEKASLRHTVGEYLWPLFAFNLSKYLNKGQGKCLLAFVPYLTLLYFGVAEAPGAVFTTQKVKLLIQPSITWWPVPVIF